jgi:hypothetical protein
MDSIKNSLVLDTKEPVIPYSVMRYDLPRICRVPYVPGKQVRYSFEARPLSIIGRIKRKLGYTTNLHDIGLSFTWTDKIISIEITLRGLQLQP